MLKIFFASDVHGCEVCFRKFLNAGKFYRVNIVMLGGDLTGKMVVPVVKQSEGTYVANLSGREWVVRTQSEIDNLTKLIQNSGYYPYLTTEEEMQSLQSDEENVKKLFSELMASTMQRWIRLAEDRLRDANIRCFITPGNDDQFVIDKVINESDFVVNPEGQVVDLDEGLEMISTGFTNPTPWNTPRELPEEELEKKIEAMIAQVKNMNSCIFNLHCPPIGTIIDQAPKLDETMKIVRKSGHVIMIDAGSQAVRNTIEKHQPLLGLHGHIHEGKGVAQIGKTICLNPGSEYGEGILRGVIVALDKAKIKSHLFTSG